MYLDSAARSAVWFFPETVDFIPMRVLDRYIVSALCRHIALSMLVLLVLAGLFLFVNEQGWVGAGSYGQAAALRYVLAQLPATALQFLPVAALLGALLAMGELARGSELTVMRAAGVSVGRIAASMALAGVLLLPVAVLVAEWLAPPLAQAARTGKALARNGSLSLAEGAAWLRDGERLVRVDPQGAVTVFELQGARLAAMVTAARSLQQPDGSRRLLDAVRVRFDASGAQQERHAAMALGAGAGTELFRLVAADPRQQSTRQLWQGIARLQAQGQDATAQRFALWSGVARLAAIPLAMLLALPLLLGFMRGAGAGSRASLGLLLGLLYFLIQRTVENGTLAFALNPVLLAWLPTLLLAAAVLLLLWRTRRLSAA